MATGIDNLPLLLISVARRLPQKGIPLSILRFEAFQPRNHSETTVNL